MWRVIFLLLTFLQGVLASFQHFFFFFFIIPHWEQGGISEINSGDHSCVTDPFASHPHLLEMKWNWNSWRISNEYTTQRILGGGKNLLACLGSLSFSLQNVGWDLNISQGSFLFPHLCQESASAGGFRLTCPGKMGARGRCSSLSQSYPKSAAPTQVRALMLLLLLELAVNVHEDQSPWLRRCCFYKHFANYRVTVRVWLYLAKPVCKKHCLSPEESCLLAIKPAAVYSQICSSLVPSISSSLKSKTFRGINHPDF